MTIGAPSSLDRPTSRTLALSMKVLRCCKMPAICERACLEAFQQLRNRDEFVVWPNTS